MTVSAITAITLEGQPKELSSFLCAGVMYIAWTDATGTGVGVLKKIRWKPHNGADYSEVVPSLSHVFKNPSVVYHPALSAVVAVWEDGTSVLGQTDGNIYIARFNVATGAVLSGPTFLCRGSDPKITHRTSSSDDFLVYFRTPKNGGVYGKPSSDGGVTWQSAAPIITNQVSGTESLAVVPYDDTHVSIAQIGKDTRGFYEYGLYVRTRPLVSIVKHPSVANQFYVAEPSKLDNTTLVDNLRGALKLNAANTELLHLSGVQQGTTDGVSAVSLLSVSGTAVTNLGSVGPVAGVAGHNLVSYGLNLVAGSLAVVLPGATSCAVDLSVSSAYAYVAEYSDSTTSGQFVVVRLSDGTSSTVLTAVTGVRAVAVTDFLGTQLIFVATTESGIERLRVYQENALTPTLLLNTKLPARANSIALVEGISPAVVRAYVSMVDRFGTYDYFGASLPVRTTDSFFFPGGGQLFRARPSTNGNVFVAAGSAGVLVFSGVGRLLSQLTVSGESILPWKAGTAYSLGSFSAPRATHPFAANRSFFRCTAGGTSGTSEPAWATLGTVSDGGASWVLQGSLDGVVTDLAIDEATKRIYAVGVAGGNLGTDGRVWVLSAGRLL